jgi:hypothetical protein
MGIITGRNKFMSGAGFDDEIFTGSSGDKAKMYARVELINSNHVSFAAHLSLLAEEDTTPYFKTACLAVESLNEDEIRSFQTDLEHALGVKPLARICMYHLWEASSAGKGKIKFGTEALEQWKALTPNLRLGGALPNRVRSRARQPKRSLHQKMLARKRTGQMTSLETGQKKSPRTVKVNLVENVSTRRDDVKTRGARISRGQTTVGD